MSLPPQFSYMVYLLCLMYFTGLSHVERFFQHAEKLAEEILALNREGRSGFYCKNSTIGFTVPNGWPRNESLSYPYKARDSTRSRDCAAQHPAQDFQAAVSPVLALPMGVMFFLVVVLPPGLMGLLNLRPGSRIGKCEIG